MNYYGYDNHLLFIYSVIVKTSVNPVSLSNSTSKRPNVRNGKSFAAL